MVAGAIAGWAADAAKDVGMGYLNDMFSARQMERGYKYSRKLARYLPSDQVKGLRRAGLNPILAAGGMKVGGGQPIVAHSARAVQSGSRSSYIDVMTGRNLAEQHKLLRTQSYKTKAEGDKARAEADAIAKYGLGVSTTLGRYGHSLGGAAGRVWQSLPSDAGFWEFMTGTPTTKRPASAKETRSRAKRTGSSVEQKKHRLVRPTRGY